MSYILIGMPGSGKSTIGVLLAKECMLNFTDTDIVLQRKTGNNLCDIINKQGIEVFLKFENEVLKEIDAENAVISTGGSAVYCDEGMKRLKQYGKIIYLKVDTNELKNRLNNIKTRGIAMQEGTTIEELYTERAPLYEKWADIIVDCNGETAEENLRKIRKKIERGESRFAP